LVATWSLALGLLGGWVLPLAEPYRLPSHAARRLAEAARREHAAPMLASFQEPSMIYAMGHPGPIMRERRDLIDTVRRRGAVVSVLIPPEVGVLLQDARLRLEVLETIEGYNLTKGRRDRIELVVIRPSRSAARGPSEQVLVK